MTYNFRESVEKRMLAEAGVERAIMEIAYRNFFRNQVNAPTSDELKAWRPDGTPYTGAMARGYYTVRAVNESGKIALNGITDQTAVVLRNLLLRLDCTQEQADVIVDSILDWRDGDDLHRLNGAESDYYLSLPVPYRAKNGDFDTLEELLLVKGITQDLLYGKGERKGLAGFVSVHSKQRGVSLLFAPKEILLSIPGMTDTATERIMTSREAMTDQSVLDFRAILGDLATAVGPYLSSADETTFTITSSGHIGTEKGGYTIAATVVIDRSGKHWYLYYKSPAEVIR